MSGSMRKTSGNTALMPGAISGRPPRSGPARAIFELTKFHLSLYIGLSAVAGHGLAQDHVSAASLILGIWTVLLASGSAVLNNIQDREYDSRFERTRSRVLACNHFSLAAARCLALALILIGLAGLSVGYTSVWPAVFGAIALICYNGLYTPLKKTHPLLAMLPGTLCGMIPPAMGWAAAPGPLSGTDLTGLIILMVCLGIWQWPHTMLVAARQISKYGESNRFLGRWSPLERHFQILIWTLLFSLAMGLFLVHGWIVEAWIA
ncbi:MAG: UbiA family prenyltransferase, partial [Desulfobacterales bacterium]|nr:UbiA family prenyltransferase [Desulfobacterales bacterium]